jgi:hypothetical protein
MHVGLVDSRFPSLAMIELLLFREPVILIAGLGKDILSQCLDYVEFDLHRTT